MVLVFTNEKCIGCNKCIHVCSCMGANIFVVQNGKNRIEVDEKNVLLVELVLLYVNIMLESLKMTQVNFLKI